MEVTVNGEKRSYDGPMTLLGVVESLGLRPGSVAVERNLIIVPRKGMDREMIRDGDVIEIIRLVGGG
jgi:thiamine biosynthesis protein ThiS